MKQEIIKQYDEVESIYRNIKSFTQGDDSKLFTKPTIKHDETPKVIKRYVLIPAILIVITIVFGFVASIPYQYIKAVVLLLLLVFYVGLGAAQLLEIYAEKDSTFQFLNDPNIALLEGVSSTSEKDIQFSLALKEYSKESLLLVKNRLQTQQLSVQRRIGAMVGAIDKIGVLPGMLTLYLAAISKGMQVVEFTIVGVVFIMYVFAYSVHFALPRLGFVIEMIKSEIDSRN